MGFSLTSKKLINNIPLNPKFYKILLYGILIVHVIYLTFFVSLKIYSLAIFNVASCLMYFTLIFFLKRSKYDLVVSATYIEIIAHIILCTYALGWNSGFCFLLFPLISSPFFMPYKNTKIPFHITFFCAILFFILKFTSCLFVNPFDSIPHIYMNILFVINGVISILPIIAFTVFFNNLYNKSRDKLSEKNKHLAHIAGTDPLTGLSNRRSMVAEFEKASLLRKNTATPFSLMILDIDDFKKVNDTYGHDCGDYVLKCLSNYLNYSIKDSDTVCRWGGEEILILLNNCNNECAKKYCESIRFGIENMELSYKQQKIGITVTVGISCSNQSVEEMLLEADTNLYFGKNHGKNCVICNENCHRQ